MWFKLSGDARLGHCASENCGGQPTWRLEADGVGSNYCSGCKQRIECHCGKDGHALGSINCPVHGRPQAAIDSLTNHQVQCDEDGMMIQVSRQALDEVLTYISATHWRSLNSHGEKHGR